MLFNSHAFLFLFLPITLWGFWVLFRVHRARIWLLTLSSYLFYAVWDYRFTVLMLVCTAVTFVAAVFIYRAQRQRMKQLWLVVSIVICLAQLGMFKYADFLAGSINMIIGGIGFAAPFPTFGILLPVGISFFTFQALSYTIDVYRSRIEPGRSFLEYACFVSLFPQLVAGPIVRYSVLAGQLRSLKTRLEQQDFIAGVFFLIIGLGKKLLIADQIGIRIDPLWANFREVGFGGAWLMVLGYAYQLYFDFSGYSDMAVGLGRFLGLRLPRNFKLPYTAGNVSDFWRRWHISLSSWLRDYLYVSLGGSRKGTIRTLRNLAVTMLLGGLWHGASWTFVIWGAYHGALLAGYHFVRSRWQINLSHRQGQVLTFLLVIIGWIFFRSETFGKALFVLGALLGIHGLGISSSLANVSDLALIGLLLVAACFSHCLPDTWDMKWEPRPRLAFSLSVIGITSVLLIDQGSRFLYYQF